MNSSEAEEYCALLLLAEEEEEEACVGRPKHLIPESHELFQPSTLIENVGTFRYACLIYHQH